MVLRMLAEVFLVVVDRHLVDGQPAIARLTLMPDEHLPACRCTRSRIGSSFESSTVTSWPRASRRLMPMFFHTLMPRAPSSNAASTSRSACCRCQPGSFQPCVENVATNATRSGCGPRERVQSRADRSTQEVRVVDVDRDQAKAILGSLFDQRGVVRVEVYVNIDLVDGGEVRLAVQVIGGSCRRRARRRAVEINPRARRMFME